MEDTPSGLAILFPIAVPPFRPRKLCDEGWYTLGVDPGITGLQALPTMPLYRSLDILRAQEPHGCDQV